MELSDLAYGPRLKALRAAQGLRQDDVAARAGVSQSLVSDLEARHRPPGRKTAQEAAARVERLLTGAEDDAEDDAE